MARAKRTAAEAAAAEASRRLAEARLAVDAARKDAAEFGRPHAGPLLYPAWRLYGAARSAYLKALQVSAESGTALPDRLQREFFDVYDGLRAIDL